MHELSFVALLGLVTACSTLQGDTAARTLTAASSVPTSFEARQLASPVVANVPVLPHGLTSFGAVEHEGVLYVLGGYSGMPHAYSAKDQHGELLAYEDGQWSIVSEVPKVQGAALVSHATGLVRVGGMRALNETVSTESELVSVDTVQRFNASDGTWSDLPALPQGRSSHDAVVIGDTLFVVGGWTLDHQPKAGAWSSDMFTLDLSREGAVWKRRATPFSRRALAVASAGGKLFVLGGMDAERRISQSLEVYEPGTDAWTQAANFPGQGFGMAAVGRGSTVHARVGSTALTGPLDATARGTVLKPVLEVIS